MLRKGQFTLLTNAYLHHWLVLCESGRLFSYQIRGMAISFTLQILNSLNQHLVLVCEVVQIRQQEIHFFLQGREKKTQEDQTVDGCCFDKQTVGRDSFCSFRNVIKIRI